jgi:hypothetical protein
MGAAAGLASIAAVLGYLPMSFTRPGDSYETRANAFMIGLGLRLFVTLGALTAVWFAGVPQRGVVVAWTGVLYGVLLVVELIVVARSLRDPARSPHAPRPTA